jgi:hypothetical protein
MNLMENRGNNEQIDSPKSHETALQCHLSLSLVKLRGYPVCSPFDFADA